MKRKYSKSITVAALLPLLAACAGPKITSRDVEIARHQAEAQRACWAAQAEAAKAAPLYADARDQALVIMAQALAGQGQAQPCAVTNVYDSRARIAEAQSQAVARVVPGVVSGAVAVAGVVAGADVLKTAVRQTGNTTTTTIAGSGNRAAHHDTRISTENRMNSRGANSPVSATSDAAGPDLHRTETTTTTVTEAAP